MSNKIATLSQSKPNPCEIYENKTKNSETECACEVFYTNNY